MSKIGYVEHTQVKSESDLRKLLSVEFTEHSGVEESIFFLRWAHKVSGLVAELPEQFSPEGQWLTAIAELRWKRDRNGYQILWLGQQSAKEIQPLSDLEWTPIDRTWETDDDKPVLLHDRRTPQFPHLFNYPTRLSNRLRQRYFRDANTGIVHFVALAIHPAQSSSDQPQL